VHSGMKRATRGAKSVAESRRAALIGSREKLSLKISIIASPNVSFAIAYLKPRSSWRNEESTL
jgi:hypothetical protein